MSRAMSSFVFIMIYILLITLRSARKTKGSSSAATKPAAARTAAPDRPTPTIPALAKRRAQKDEDCDYGEVNHQYSHSNEKRVAQLKGYLDAGLIDKKEYAQMLERYTRQDQAYDSMNY